MTKLADLKTIQKQVNELSRLVDGMVTAELKAQVPPEAQREQQAAREKAENIKRLEDRIVYLKGLLKDKDYPHPNDATRNLKKCELDLQQAKAA